MKNIKNLLALATMAILAVACGSTAATSGTATDTGAAADDTTDSGVAADGTAAGDTAAADMASAPTLTCTAPGAGGFKGCTGDTDQKFLGTLKDPDKVKKFKDDVRTCTLMKGCGAKSTYADKVQCITDCMVDIYKGDGLTENCARCYGFTGQCGVEKCISKCAVDTGECDPCLAQYCDGGAACCKASTCEPKSGGCAPK